MSKILVTGATGQLGKEVIKGLIKKVNPSDISALVRDASKAEDLKNKGIELRTGDYSNYSSLVNAFNNTDKLYFISGSDIATRVQQHENVIKAAKEAGVKHIVYTSFQRKNETASSPIAMVAESHLKAEEWLINSGITYTILKHGLYMDMLPIFMGEKVLENGTIYQPAGEGKTAYTLRSDLAELGVTILTGTGHENKTYDAFTSEAYSYPEIADILSKISGKQINYVSPSTEEFIKTVTEAGLPMEYAGMFAGFAEAIKQGEFEETTNEFESLLGRKSTNLRDYLKLVYTKN